MTDSMLPIIRQMHNAADDHVRALVLLSVPDSVLMKYLDVFQAVCRRAHFDLGLQFIDIRHAEWSATRGPDGRHRNPLFDQVRDAFAAYARAGTAS
ncbi:MAG: hypothetical protein BGN87_00235 [Rhizobiales bacterium 65-79]|nr:hypothetical protein [Hyphomicrobiales bacterium]OJU02613.1 MAG: hypothetical protein BGN87_00235 [Rhizobiales bacterium 65-79]